MAANPAPLAAAYDVARVRADFPILATTVHGHPLVYLDSAASSQRPRAVLARSSDYETHSHANVHRGVHALSQAATAAFEGRASACAASSMQPPCARWCSCAARPRRSTSWRSPTAAPPLPPGDEILITALEHHADIVPWQMLCEQTGGNSRSPRSTAAASSSSMRT